ncbi:MAG: glycosyltransferase [Caldilineaceae bacterium]
MTISTHPKLGSLLYHSHHTVGVGHLVRALALVAALQTRFDVTFLSGGVFPAGLAIPPGVNFVQLPALMRAASGRPQSAGSDRPWTETMELRRAAVLAHFAHVAPAVVVVESFPFGHRLLMSELLSLLDANRHRAGGPARVYASIRDIMERDKDAPVVRRPGRQPGQPLLRRHSGPHRPALHHPGRHLPAQGAAGVPVHHTGFVTRTGPLTAPERDATPARPYLLASAGGGRVGGPLLRAVLAAYLASDLPRRVDLVVVTGPFLPEEECARLETTAARYANVKILRWTDDMRGLMRHAAGSVSQCGYNTTMDLLASGVPALVVPYHTPHDFEQSTRAAIGGRGLVRTLAPGALDEAALGRELAALLDFKPAHRA